MEPEKEPSLWPLAVLASIFGLLAWLKIKPVDATTEEEYPCNNDTHKEKPLSPATAKELKTVEPLSHKKDGKHERGNVHPYLKFGVSVLTLLAVVWYASEARKQRVLMDQQLKGTDAAFLEVYPAVGTKIGDFDITFNVLKVVIRNSGHTNATNVAFHISISQLTIEGKPLGQPVIYDIFEPVLGYRSGTAELHRSYLFEDAEDATKILEAAGRLEQTVRIEWYYSYDNGFNEVIKSETSKSETSCVEFLSKDWVSCENFPAMLHDLRSKTQMPETKSH